MRLGFFIAVWAFVSCGTGKVNQPVQERGDIETVDALLAGSCAAPFEGSGTLKFDTAKWTTDFCKHSVPYREIRGGGPPRDGIPPIDTPKFTSLNEADLWLADVEPIIAVEIDGVARAYPLQILIWHEIVNDKIAEVPVAITFCPLCYAAVVFKRPVIAGKTLTFGTSGNLRNSDMVMWDRQTQSWWQQFEGIAIVGALTGKQLEILPGSIVSWQSFKAAFPGGSVLSRDTGIKRPYGKNPYAGYDDISKKPFLYQGRVQDGLPPMAHIVGVDRHGLARAYPLDVLQEKRVINDQLGDDSLAIFWQPGAASALQKKVIAESDDIGATGVFLRTLDGRELTFTALNEQTFIDEQTRSHWDLFGIARSGPLKGKRLTAIAHHRVFWFAWSAFIVDRGTLYTEKHR